MGCGYLGSRVARAWSDAGTQVWAATRSDQRAGELERAGIRPIVWDILRPRPASIQLPSFDAALYAVGYDRKAAYSRAELHLHGLANVLILLQECSPSISRLLYTSTTGVYGGDDGRWVDEESTCEPSTESGRVYVDAERTLADSPLGPKSIVLRLAGIYGPDRVPRPQVAAGDQPRYLNLVHIDDAVAAVLLVAEVGQPPAVFNVADGHPVFRDEFRQSTLMFHGSAESAAAAPAVGGRHGQNKRVCSEKIRRELGFQFRFPDFKAGLAAIAAESPRIGC